MLLEVLRDVVVDRELAGVHDRHIQPGLARVIEERRVHRLADDVVPAEGEREVGDATRDLHAGQASLDDAGRIDERVRVVRVLLHPGRDRQDVRVEDDVRRVVAGLLGEHPIRPLADLDLALDGVCLPLLVEGHHDDRGTVALDSPRLVEEVLLALLEADRVHDTLALHAFQAGLDHVPAGRVHHDRHPRHLGLRGEEVQVRRHRLGAVEQVGVHVDVEQVGAVLDLLPRDVDGRLEVAALDQTPELLRARDVLAFAHHHEARIGPDDERLETAERGERLVGVGDLPRRKVRDRLRDLPDVLRRGPAAPAEDVGQSRARELADVGAGDLGVFVVQAERVGESRVGVARRVGGGDPRERLEVGAHLRGAERAVDPDDQGLRVLDREPERLRGLSREVPAALVDRREREPERHVRGDVLGGGDGRLRVQRVEDRLDLEHVDTAVHEPADLLRIRLRQLVERDRPVRRILDLRRDREGPVRRADGADDEPVLGSVERAPSVLGGRTVHVVDEVLQPVLRL